LEAGPNCRVGFDDPFYSSPNGSHTLNVPVADGLALRLLR